ncbi:uncharacterized protein ACN427_006423 [Glossina fuscipes fuscipes]
MGLRVVGIVPCTCQCWHGPKAPKLSTVGSNARANAVPYVINTNTVSPSCAECKRKLDQEQQQIQFQQHHLNCAFNTQQSQQHQHLPHCLSMQCSSLLNPSNATTNNQLYNVPPPSLIPSILPAVLQTGQNANVSTKFLLTSTNTAPSNAVLTTVPLGMPSFMAPTLTNTNGSLTLLPSNQIPPGSQSYLPNATGPTGQNKNSATHDNLTSKFKENLLTKKVPTLRSTAAAALTAQKKRGNTASTRASSESCDEEPTLIEDSDDDDADDKSENGIRKKRTKSIVLCGLLILH